MNAPILEYGGYSRKPIQEWLNPFLIIFSFCTLLTACKLDVTYEIDHELRAIELDRSARSLTLRYEIQESRVWQQWPCVAHGCGDSERLATQTFDLEWSLPAHSPDTTIAHVGFRPHVRESSRSSRDDVASALVVGKGAVQFTEDDRIGRFPVLKMVTVLSPVAIGDTGRAAESQ
jgi:hypothetical protein